MAKTAKTLQGILVSEGGGMSLVEVAQVAEEGAWKSVAALIGAEYIEDSKVTSRFLHPLHLLCDEEGRKNQQPIALLALPGSPEGVTFLYGPAVLLRSKGMNYASVRDGDMETARQHPAILRFDRLERRVGGVPEGRDHPGFRPQVSCDAVATAMQAHALIRAVIAKFEHDLLAAAWDFDMADLDDQTSLLHPVPGNMSFGLMFRQDADSAIADARAFVGAAVRNGKLTKPWTNI